MRGSVADLLHKLRIFFEIFVYYNICIKPSKTFLNYPDVGFLGQKVNSLGLTTAKDKLKAIRLLCYPETLGALEYYLGLTGYLRSCVHFCAQLAEPLQALKTTLLKGGPVSGAPRRAFASKTRLPLQTAREEASFIALQNTLSKSSMLVHHNLERNLWIDLNASKDFGFGAILFYVNKRVIVPDRKWPKRSSIEPLLFFSRLFSTAEKNYGNC